MGQQLQKDRRKKLGLDDEAEPEPVHETKEEDDTWAHWVAWDDWSVDPELRYQLWWNEVKLNELEKKEDRDQEREISLKELKRLNAELKKKSKEREEKRKEEERIMNEWLKDLKIKPKKGKPLWKVNLYTSGGDVREKDKKSPLN